MKVQEILHAEEDSKKLVIATSNIEKTRKNTKSRSEIEIIMLNNNGVCPLYYSGPFQ